jgi:hypothetical protein
LFIGVLITSSVLASCGDGVCEENEKYCTSSSVDCELGEDCFATADCGTNYCPSDCEASSGELDKCVSDCKTTFDIEEDRSPCIRECKGMYDFNDDHSREVCCNEPGPADEPTYKWRNSKDCWSPEGSVFPVTIVNDDMCKKEFRGKPGTTPDSIFYFLDSFFDRFGDDLEVREEKIAEIKQMVEAGDIESAKKALKLYMETAEKFKKEVDPDRKNEALESVAAIKSVMRELENQIPESDKEDFDSIVKTEGEIGTAAEIASKINELCRELSELDPELFYDNCMVNEDGPEWHKNMFRDLTEEQKKEAEKFGEIMGQCFESSGQDCRCEEIPYPSFANACSRAAPLATACDIEGDEKACKKLDNLNMPALPPHLEEIMRSLEGGMNEKKFEMHMPSECQEAGVTSPKECGKIMITIHAPEECKEALLAANVEDEYESREICDKIMYELRAPPECIERGITEDEECKDFMWGIGNRPKECQDNQIHDFRDCKKFLEGDRPSMGGSGSGLSFNCRNIDDPMERLDCYDNAGSQVGGYTEGYGPDYNGPCMTPQDWEVKKQECRDLYGPHAGDEPIMSDSGNGHQCAVDLTCIDFGQYDSQEGPDEWEDDWDDWNEGDGTYNECSDGCDDECPGASSTSGCENNGNTCICHYDDDGAEGEGESEGEGEGESEGEGEGESEGEGEAESEGEGEGE